MSTMSFSLSREMRVSRKASWPLDSCSMVKEICWLIEFNRELKQTTTATATGTLLNKRFNEQNNSCARAL